MTETDLRWQLRQLPREMAPARDLWPGVLAGIRQPPARSPRRWLAGLAMAASVLLAAGLFWRGPSSPPAPGEAMETAVVRAEARALTDEYQAALRQFDGAPVSAQIGPSLQALDRSVLQIRRAIATDPDSVFLLQQLRKTYSRRLALTQRAVTS